MTGAALLLAAWTISAPADWTPSAYDAPQNVRVIWSQSEGGVAVGPTRWYRLADGTSIDVPSDPALEGTGRTICLTAYAMLVADPSVRSAPVTLCHTFPADLTLQPPRVCTP